MDQSYKDYELIIIDDGSTDKTFEIIKGFNDGCVICLRNGENLGMHKSLNKGLREAGGTYIARIDDDDLWIDEDKLKKQVEFLDGNPDSVLIGTGVVVVDENGTELKRRFLPEKDDEIRDKMLEENCFIHSSVMFRKSAAMKFGGYSEKMEALDTDYDLWLKFGTIGKLANLPIYGVKYTVRPRSMSTQNRIVPFIRDIKLINKYKNRYPNYWRAMAFRFVELLNRCLHSILDFPVIATLKKALKSKYPNFWQKVKVVHKFSLNAILGVLKKL